MSMLGKLTALLLIAGAAFLASSAAAQSDHGATNYLWKECTEDAVLFKVEPGSLEEVVGTDVRLFLEEGQAQVLVVAQDCPAMWFNGEQIGPAQEVHQWVRVEAISDERTVVGAQHTLPTMTWLATFIGSTNARSRRHWEGSGTRAVPIEGLSLDPPAPRRGGEIRIDSDRRYSWAAQSAEPFARLVGVNHDVFVRDERGNHVYHRIQCLATVQAFGSSALLEVTGVSDLEGLVEPGEYEASVHTFAPIWCRATLADERQP